jgi:hypothetical protein
LLARCGEECVEICIERYANAIFAARELQYLIVRGTAQSYFADVNDLPASRAKKRGRASG